MGAAGMEKVRCQFGSREGHRAAIVCYATRIKTGRKIDSKAYQCGTYYFYQPGIFEEEDDRRQTERIMSGDYTTGDFIVDAIFDTIGLFVK